MIPTQDENESSVKQVTVEEEPNFPEFGSADVEIATMNDCGVLGTPATYIICDNEKTIGSVNFYGPKKAHSNVTNFSRSTGSAPLLTLDIGTSLSGIPDPKNARWRLRKSPA